MAWTSADMAEMRGKLNEKAIEIGRLNAKIVELEAGYEIQMRNLDAAEKAIAEKDVEIHSMIAVHNSDVDGLRMQEEKIEDQKMEIAALREALKPFAALDVRGWVSDPLISGSTYAGLKMQIDRADFYLANQAITGVNQSAIEQTTGDSNG